jgi:hypothetical protein
MNTMTINGYHIVITYDKEIAMFRGEFTGLNGGADFYATDIMTLRKEGEISLRVFLESCRERGKAYTYVDRAGVTNECPYPRKRDLVKEEQEPFWRWMEGQTCPGVYGLLDEDQDYFYPWDYDRWKAGLEPLD